jgi:hypothetical protein
MVCLYEKALILELFISSFNGNFIGEIFEEIKVAHFFRQTVQKFAIWGMEK